MTLFNACSFDLIQFANAWASLGDAVQGQVETVLNFGEDADVNENAIKLALEHLSGLNEEVDGALMGWLDAR